jgi:hypothetical protein
LKHFDLSVSQNIQDNRANPEGMEEVDASVDDSAEAIQLSVDHSTLLFTIRKSY